MDDSNNRITWRALLLGTLFSGLFAYLTVYFENRRDIILTATQLSVLPYVLLVLCVVAINPVCRLVRFIRAFSVAEILIVFVMGAVSSGISTFGLASQIIPAMGNLFNKHWNNEQTRWDIYIEPFMSESFFLAEPGIQDAAIAYQSALVRYEEVKKVNDLAKNLEDSMTAVKDAERKLEETKALVEDEVTKIIKVNRAQANLRYARKAMDLAQEAWKPFSAVHDRANVLVSYPPRVEEAHSAMEARQKELRGLEQKAFEKVEAFRRGIKDKDKDLRAIPGFFPQPGEDLGMYFSRARRLRLGLKAMRPLSRLQKDLARRDGDRPASEAAAEIRAAVESATQALAPIADPSALKGLNASLTQSVDALSADVEARSKALRDLNQQRRLAKPEEFSTLDAEIKRATKTLAGLTKRRASVGLELERNRQELDFCDKVGKTLEGLQTLQAAATASPPKPIRDVLKELDSLHARFARFDGTLGRFLAADIPWGQWLRPLFNWGMVILLTYVVLMCFNVLIFRQWAHNEKLIYPLAELPEILAGHGDKEKSAIPAIFRSGMFWFGVSVSAVILGFNLFVKTQVVPGLKEIPLTFAWRDYVQGTVFSGLYYSQLHIFFTMVGLSFLIPAKISFSLWFFYILYLLQLQIMVWAGYGVNERSFPCFWWDELNFRTAESGGALLVFAALILYKVRHFIFCSFRPEAVGHLEPDERRELRSASFLFLAGSVALILFLWLGMGANLFYTVFCYLIVVVITIGLVRAVAEGGVLGFQCWFSPFHMIRSITGMDKTWTCPSLFAPLLVYYSILFLDIKTFIAPAMANSIKIRDDLKMARGRFHLAIFLGIGIAAVVSILGQIILAYSSGADGMQGWFHTNFPQLLFQKIVLNAKTRPIDTTSGGLWLGFGAGLMAILLYFRQFLFWLPHPIGMIMLVNPIMQTYWFSIFLGWLFKSLVTKYGNKDTYGQTRAIFVGLIVGELAVIILAMVLTLALGVRIPIDLNRN